MSFSRLVITEHRPNQLTIRIEAEPPIPLRPDGMPDVDSPDFNLTHNSAIAAAMHLGDLSGNPVEWRSLFT